MGQNATTRILPRLVACLAAGASLAAGQSTEWRQAGTKVIDADLASPASGFVDRVWYSPSGDRLYARTYSSRVYETVDFETWKPAAAAVRVPEVSDYANAATKPESGAHARAGGRVATARIYAFGEALYQSEDEGQSWRNVSHFQGDSILGDGFSDLAVSPRDSEEIVAANRFGVWRSLDGGLTWAGLNEDLPNLPVRKLYQVGSRMRISLDGGTEAVWSPGQRTAWTPAPAEFSRREMAARNTVSIQAGARVTALADSGEFVYAGSDGGRIWSSADRGRNWRVQVLGDPALAVAAVFAPADEPRVALAAAGARIYRTFNGGLFWDDITANLAASGEVRGITADVVSGVAYAATRGGVFMTYLDLRSAAAVTSWTRLEGLPSDAPAWDVKLDEGGHQIFAAIEGHGVFAALAPHRLRDPRVVNAADRSTRAAAPGSLLSVIGAAVESARLGNTTAPVLGASASESQIQVPFEATPGISGLSLNTGSGSSEVPLPVAAASPAIFVDRDGSPMLLDADRGVLLEPGSPIRAGSRLQILATGLGRVTPQWPTGTPAPAENTPRVVVPVRAFVDRVPVEVARATLAPGFIGFYLVEVIIPETVNNGPAELYVEAAGQSSGRVAIQLVQ